MNEHTFPDRPEGFRGCLTCLCGGAIGRFGPQHENPSLAAQARAGEEDQSQPGWDAL